MSSKTVTSTICSQMQVSYMYSYFGQAFYILSYY